MAREFFVPDSLPAILTKPLLSESQRLGDHASSVAAPPPAMAASHTAGHAHTSRPRADLGAIASQQPHPPAATGHGAPPAGPFPDVSGGNEPDQFFQSLLTQVMGIVRQRLSQPQFEAWIRPLQLVTVTETCMVLGAGTEFHRNWIWKNYRTQLTDALEAVMGTKMSLQLVVLEGITQPSAAEPSSHGDHTGTTPSPLPIASADISPPREGGLRDTLRDVLEQTLRGEPPPAKKRPITADQSPANRSSRSTPTNQQPPRIMTRTLTEPAEPRITWTPRTSHSNLNPRYTFENFVVGQHARFCHAAAMAVAEGPAQHYNPFFVYGGVGLGKTHLIQAIGHRILQLYPDLVVRYVTAEVFTNELIARLSKKEDMRPFRDRYRNCDVLIVDDVQFLEGKDRTQTEIFHTFNTLYESGRQIILSSDRPPQALSILEERLRNRFEKGLIADIQPPDLETRIAILKNRLLKDHQSAPIDLDVLTFIAEMHPKNIRELEGALTKVAAYYLLTQTPIDLDSARRILGGNTQTGLSMDHILDTVARYFHLSVQDVKSGSRQKDIAHARHVAIYVLRELTEMSFPKLGEFFSGRKHTTILYAYEKVREDLQRYPALQRQVQEIFQRVRAGV